MISELGLVSVVAGGVIMFDAVISSNRDTDLYVFATGGVLVIAGLVVLLPTMG